MAQWEPLFAVNTAPCFRDEEYGVGKEKNKEYLTIFRESHGGQDSHYRINALSPVVSVSCVSRQQSTVIQIILGPEGAGAEKKSLSTRSPVFEAKSRIRWQTDTLGI